MKQKHLTFICRGKKQYLQCFRRFSPNQNCPSSDALENKWLVIYLKIIYSGFDHELFMRSGQKTHTQKKSF